MEDYAIVLEYMPTGRPTDSRREPLVQLVGTKYFTLLEATLKQNVTVVVGQKVYVGKDNRAEIERIKGRIKYEDLTTSAKEILPKILKRIVEESESYFIDFLNKAKPITIRVHTLDFLPGIGKKSLEVLLEERDKKPFESFQDLKTRVPTLQDPTSLFVNRILNELQGHEKHFLFTKPFSPHSY
jgi:putative nucleotide binding protein